ncbi:MAG: SpoIID/LytB domain-containing protein, partial [Lachnospiraceae bacterium]|nr:SpoIID/LytB domain-containing protein [Lachnospiraceae bacterium]
IFAAVLRGEHCESAGAEQPVMTDIRGGLEALSAGKAELTIKNEKIGLGYCIKDDYRVDVEFESRTGFRFTAAGGYYCCLLKTFSSYESAERAAVLIRNLGVDAWPVAIYRNYWRVYAGGASGESEARRLLELLQGRYGYYYSEPSADNGHRLLVAADGCSFLIDGEKKGAYPQFKALTADGKGNFVLSLGSRSYRGRLELGRYGQTGLTAVNIIQVDSYLYGVVPCEMPSYFESEALRAQAVCARSYALMRVGYRADSNIGRAYYLGDTTKDQVYRGYTAETMRTTQAVDATAGQLVRYLGQPVTAYYFSTSGGSTENVSEVWGMKLDYLAAVPDLFETEPEKQPWLTAYTGEQLRARLAAYGQQTGTIVSVSPQVTTMSGRVYSLKLKGTNGNAILQTGTIREVLSLYSTKFKVVTKGDVPDRAAVLGVQGSTQARISDCWVISAGGAVEKAPSELEQYIAVGSGNFMNYPKNAPTRDDVWYFYGMGYGHGVGMSQSGANGLAKQGFSCRQIIEYYFPGCRCE